MDHRQILHHFMYGVYRPKALELTDLHGQWRPASIVTLGSHSISKGIQGRNSKQESWVEAMGECCLLAPHCLPPLTGPRSRGWGESTAHKDLGSSPPTTDQENAPQVTLHTSLTEVLLCRGSLFSDDSSLSHVDKQLTNTETSSLSLVWSKVLPSGPELAKPSKFESPKWDTHLFCAYVGQSGHCNFKDHLSAVLLDS